MKQNKRQPLTAEAQTPGPQNDQTFSLKVSVSPSPPAPTAQEIQNAIDVLAGLMVGSTSIAEVGSTGDVFLVYDLSITTPGKPAFRIQDRRKLHSLLTKENVLQASESFDSALVDIIRPMKSTIMSWKNEVTAALPKAGEEPLSLPFGR